MAGFHFKPQKQRMRIAGCDMLKCCCELERMHRNNAVVIYNQSKKLR